MLARFCPRCGAATSPFEQEGRPRARCPDCGFTDWGNPKPAVGAILARGDRLLLSKRAREPHKGEWDLVGGFMEVGESPEEAILREIHEETGLRARVLGLVHAAPGVYQGFGTLNLVYHCEADGEPVASDDSEELRWFASADLPPMAWPHEAEAVRRWLARRG